MFAARVDIIILRNFFLRKVLNFCSPFRTLFLSSAEEGAIGEKMMICLSSFVYSKNVKRGLGSSRLTVESQINREPTRACASRQQRLNVYKQILCYMRCIYVFFLLCGFVCMRSAADSHVEQKRMYMCNLKSHNDGGGELSQAKIAAMNIIWFYE